MDNRNTVRSEIHPGLKVAIVLKKDQRTGTLTEGTVKKILTNSATHHRGIKVMLEENDMVGRVQKILEETQYPELAGTLEENEEKRNFYY